VRVPVTSAAPKRRFRVDTVEKGILRGPLSNIDSRRASNEQDRFKKSFARIRLFQILIPQLHFGYFFNTIGQNEKNSLEHMLSAYHPIATGERSCRIGRFVPILLQKSPRIKCRIEIRNNRIGGNGFLNQRCVSAPAIESIFLARRPKIFLQQNLPRRDIAHIMAISQTARTATALSRAESNDTGSLDRCSMPPGMILCDNGSRRKVFRDCSLWP
jgi:hypothetical protein